MMHIKAIEDISDLIALLRAFDTPLKMKAFEAIQEDWHTASEIKKKFGDKGIEAIAFFEKNKLVESRWIPIEEKKKPEKAYKAFYSSFYIKFTCPVTQLSQAAFVVCMEHKDFQKIEEKIFKLVGREGTHEGKIIEKLNVQHSELRNLINRSLKLISKGMKIERAQK
jgi:predicted DNA-binding ArsR family transcriptional regulator